MRKDNSRDRTVSYRTIVTTQPPRYHSRRATVQYSTIDRRAFKTQPAVAVSKATDS